MLSEHFLLRIHSFGHMWTQQSCSDKASELRSPGRGDLQSSPAAVHLQREGNRHSNRNNWLITVVSVPRLPCRGAQIVHASEPTFISNEDGLVLFSPKTAGRFFPSAVWICRSVGRFLQSGILTTGLDRNKVATHTYNAPLLFFPEYRTPCGVISDQWENSWFHDISLQLWTATDGSLVNANAPNRKGGNYRFSPGINSRCRIYLSYFESRCCVPSCVIIVLQ